MIDNSVRLYRHVSSLLMELGEGEVGAAGGCKRERERERLGERQTQRENSNWKSLVYKDCSLGSVKTCPATGPC